MLTGATGCTSWSAARIRRALRVQAFSPLSNSPLTRKCARAGRADAVCSISTGGATTRRLSILASPSVSWLVTADAIIAVARSSLAAAIGITITMTGIRLTCAVPSAETSASNL